mmetsp:Transcript_24083/g.66943  ORF Transcript_24083/g.66943 Transcript_24083/m.66943 type:complete len:203 (-) Transcript_24083:258-866(-)
MRARLRESGTWGGVLLLIIARPAISRPRLGRDPESNVRLLGPGLTWAVDEGGSKCQRSNSAPSSVLVSRTAAALRAPTGGRCSRRPRPSPALAPPEARDVAVPALSRPFSLKSFLCTDASVAQMKPASDTVTWVSWPCSGAMTKTKSRQAHNCGRGGALRFWCTQPVCARLARQRIGTSREAICHVRRDERSERMLLGVEIS